MSRFSRNFIALNSLAACVEKNKLRKKAKSILKWSFALKRGHHYSQDDDQNQTRQNSGTSIIEKSKIL